MLCALKGDNEREWERKNILVFYSVKGSNERGWFWYLYFHVFETKIFMKQNKKGCVLFWIRNVITSFLYFVKVMRVYIRNEML